MNQTLVSTYISKHKHTSILFIGSKHAQEQLIPKSAHCTRLEITEQTSKLLEQKIAEKPFSLVIVNDTFDRVPNPNLLLYRLRELVSQKGNVIIVQSTETSSPQSNAEKLRLYSLYFSRVIEKTPQHTILSSPIFGANSIDWGQDPFMYGPRDYFRRAITLKELTSIPRIQSVLDYGCGVGNIVLDLADKGYTVTGMDISPAAITYLKKQIKHRADTDITAINGIFETTNIKSSTFDAVWSSEVLEHTPNDDDVVKNFYRVLKPGGVCVISVPIGMRFWSDLDEYCGHYRRYSEAEIRHLFESAGFVVKKTVIWSFPLSRLWDHLIYYPLFHKKVTAKEEYTALGKSFTPALKSPWMIKWASLIFYFDQLWNWTKLGKGLILVAQK